MAELKEAGDEWEEAWNAREAALKSVLGETDGMVLHAMMPFYLGGQADVLCFPKHIPGKIAATCELLDCEDQVSNSLGNYELAIAHRDNETWGPNLISNLARYTCEAKLEPGDTMDIGPAVPKGSLIAGLLFLEYTRFSFQGKDAGILLCIGITADELTACQAGNREPVVASLKHAGVYPYTELQRSSVLDPSLLPKRSWRRFLFGGSFIATK